MEAGDGQSPPRLVNDRVYVAVGSDVQESKSTLLWALQNFGGHFRILHVHQPPEDDNDRNHLNPPRCRGHGAAGHDSRTVNQSYGYGARTPQELARQNMDKILDEYIRICNQTGVPAEKRYIEMQDIGKGIVQLIEEHAIEKLIMGAAADKRYFVGMAQLKSKKAIFVNQQADPSCYIWFICKGQLIHVREGDLNTFDMDVPPSSVSVNSAAESGSQNLRSPIGSSALSRSNSSEVEDDRSLVWIARGQRIHHKSESSSGPSLKPSDELSCEPPTPFCALEGSNDELYKQLDRAMAEAAKAKREAYEEWINRQEAEKNAIDANRRVIALQEELRRRNGLEESLAKEKEALEMTKNQLDELQMLLENALKVNEDLLTSQASEPLTANQQDFLSEFSFSEIMEAINSFDPSLKIGEGEYGSTYKGFLCNILVTIKLLSQGSSQYHQEVHTASKLRHPNLVNLIGVCTEAWTLIYEYLPNGSLEDRLCCVGNTAPLSWQTRVCICMETCAAVIYLHYHSGIAHGDLEPENILLDTNFLPKLIKSGLSCEPTAGERSFASDVYSFGLIILQLLIGKSALSLKETVQDSFILENLKDLLDPTAGHWPFEQARELAHMALRCCDINPSNRPELKSEVWPVLEQMRILSEDSSSNWSGPEEPSQPPPYFICPIYQEIMQDPQVASDGFTYEAEAIRGWFTSGHDTSPMTNLQLANLDLVPNQTLRSAIQDWLQDHEP
ncbi:U-box domain-containing protein 33-like isoform X1 [Syzygium oleosum]|uniref:U-box domain-containing protein 33-like isoform X1 n=1 Tax=Syzygium oleosum TaxID=219896 RepID=UPI0024BAE00B|nr:U-box domain-containing protein 33-like isoform X1 [Syzygium oleosum]